MSVVPSHSLTLTTMMVLMMALIMVIVLALMVVFRIGLCQVRFSVIFYRARD